MILGARITFFQPHWPKVFETCRWI